jgi:hypothetical protein
MLRLWRSPKISIALALRGHFTGGLCCKVQSRPGRIEAELLAGQGTAPRPNIGQRVRSQTPAEVKATKCKRFPSLCSGFG